MARLSKKSSQQQRQQGQALVEYVLILALLGIAMAIALAATGPAIADVFSRVICQVAGQDPCGTDRVSLNPVGAPDAFWQTVTWVAQNPQQETPYPTPPLRPPTLEPTSGGALITNTPAPSETPLPTNTLGPSATPRDRVFSMPFYDPADTTDNWRLDASTYLGGDEWIGYYYQNTSFSGTPFRVSNVSIPGANPLGLAFNWANSVPIADASWTATDNYSVRFVRRIQVATPTNLRFRLQADDRGTLYLCPSLSATTNPAANCGTPLLNNVTDQAANRSITADTWLVVQYVENTGNASVRLDITKLGGVNIDDVTSAECNWGLQRGSNTNTLDSMFDENPNADDYPAPQTCYLELRGYVDISGGARPVLSFWDVWDLRAGATAAVQVADYSEDRSTLVWRTINLRTGGPTVRNYEWTRSEIPLRNVSPALTTDRLALRFVLTSTGGSPIPARWNLDDISVSNIPESTFTVGKFWDLNDVVAQRSDFITTGRWDTTLTRTHGGAGWEDSPGRQYDRDTRGGPRIHYVEIAQPITMTGAPTVDFEGDDGVPLLSFWHAYQIAPGTRLEVQYTRDPKDAVPDTWTVIPNGPGTPPLQGGLLANNTGTTTLTDLVMRPVSIKLDQIPNYNTQDFRLRFALIVPDGGSVSDGWWFDDIRLERDGGLRYTAFPFNDGAEDDAFTERNWLRLGTWATHFGLGFAVENFVSGRTYGDSPGGNYLPNSNTNMQMKRYIDLLYDTPRNISNPTTVGEPTPSDVTARRNVTRPVLVFWHQRNLQAGTRFSVEMTTASMADNNPNSDAEWREIWFYQTPGTNPTQSPERWQQNAWERVEIDLAKALERTLGGGATWASIRSNTATDDDDILVRFRLSTGNTAANGVFVDFISIANVPEVVHRLWTTPVAGSVAATSSLGNGDGNQYDDFVENAFPTSLQFVRDRWYLGPWNPITETTTSGDVARSGAMALTDSPQDSINSPVVYPNDAYVALEMRTVMDLRGVTAAENPTLYYWQRYAIGDSQDLFRVEISVEDATQTLSQRGLMPGWSAWTAQNPLPYTTMGGSSTTRVGWQRQMVLLNSYVGKRIKVRWIINTMNPSGQADGWYIDSVSFAYNLNGGGRSAPIPLPFIDRAQGMGNWIAEGTWGLTSQWFRPDAAQAALDASLWQGYWFNETDATGSEQWWNFRGMTTTMQRLWPRPAATSNVIPTIGSTGPIRDNPTATINTLLDIWTPSESPLNGALGTAYRESVGGRFMRVVDLQPGTYVFNVSHDDGMSIWINNRTDTSVTNTSNYIYDRDNWDARTVIRQVFFTVNQPMRRVIGIDYFQGWGQGHVFVSFGREAYSFHDSPNTLALGSYTTVNALTPSVTSLISNGYFNLSTLSNPVVDFFWVGDLRNSMTIRLQFSSDGGFTWTDLWSDGNWRNFTPEWTQQVIAFNSNSTYNGLSAAAKSRIMLRFSLTNTGANRDGFYVGEVAVYNG